tara:strand:+ start:117 stop:635 length:519 start_codon:yes stop_codon:yes gene_type:complete
MSIFSTVMKAVGGSVGTAVTAGLDKVKTYLPQGVQNFLTTYSPISSADIGTEIGNIIGNIGSVPDPNDPQARLRRPSTRFSDLPSPGVISARSMTSQRLNAPGKAALMPLGSTQLISKAIQDARVQSKLAKLGGFNIPTPNLKGGITISLTSAAVPSATLSRKYGTTTTKVT